MKKGHNSLKKSSIFILLRALIVLIIALRLSFVTFDYVEPLVCG
ncbi:hypothetical protein SAMN05421856_101534 [Chryseobacterium taichungense]|uniref:Uncharacterized protein n=1 Tax=Chryseobacterium taichungense TaxID=295069 RepID=A0A1H7W840_9FLAO|nr:hypothetical protein SAMN05421856_101534 [Chryseobacterium taichungense]